MSFQTLLPMIEKAAPYLATAIGGPLAGVATKLIADKFNANPEDPHDIVQKIHADDESHEKLAEAEEGYKLELARMEQEKLELEDIEKARQLEGAVFRYVLYATLVFILMGDIAALVFVKSDEIKTLLISIAALIGLKLLPKIFKFYFGG